MMKDVGYLTVGGNGHGRKGTTRIDRGRRGTFPKALIRPVHSQDKPLGGRVTNSKVGVVRHVQEAAC